MISSISTLKAPTAIGPYSQGVISGSYIYTSGQLPIDPDTKTIPEDIAGQTKQALKNLQAILEAGGAGLDNIVKVTILLTDINTFEIVNDIYETFFSPPYPARTCYAVSALPFGVAIEIDAIAANNIFFPF